MSWTPNRIGLAIICGERSDAFSTRAANSLLASDALAANLGKLALINETEAPPKCSVMRSASLLKMRSSHLKKIRTGFMRIISGGEGEFDAWCICEASTTFRAGFVEKLLDSIDEITRVEGESFILTAALTVLS